MPPINKKAPIATRTYVIAAHTMEVKGVTLPHGTRIKGEDLSANLLKHYLESDYLVREDDWADDESTVQYAQEDVPDEALLTPPLVPPKVPIVPPLSLPVPGI